MKNVIIFGANQLAEVLYYFLRTEKKYNVCAFTVDEIYCSNDKFLDIPLVPFEEIEEYYPVGEYDMFICLGYKKMNQIRSKKFCEAKKKGYKILNYIHESSIVSTESLGEGNLIFEGVVIGAFCEIGDSNIFYPQAHVAHHTKVGNNNFFTISVAVAGNIKIGNNCFFGNNCTIKNGIDISDYSLIGAGSYVSKSTEEYSVHVPCRSVTLEGKNSLDINL